VALSHALAFVRTAAKRWQGYVWAGSLSREILVVQGADALKLGGRPCPRRRYRESSWDPARSENLGTHGGLHAREPGGPAVARGVDRCLVLDGSRGGGSASMGREGNATAVIPR
jgi:hypothetical protein